MRSTHAANGSPEPWVFRLVTLGRAVWVIACVLLLLLFLFSGWVVAAAECGEGCHEPAQVWYEDQTAWQWTGQLALVAVGAGVLGASAWLMVRRRVALAAATGLLGVLLYAGWAQVIAQHASTS
jgi:hypothetical protein